MFFVVVTIGKSSTFFKSNQIILEIYNYPIQNPTDFPVFFVRIYLNNKLF